MTWQDPVAIALAALVFVAALAWRRRLSRRGQSAGCASCTSSQPPQGEPRPQRVPLEGLRLSRRR